MAISTGTYCQTKKYKGYNGKTYTSNLCVRQNNMNVYVSVDSVSPKGYASPSFDLTLQRYTRGKWKTVATERVIDPKKNYNSAFTNVAIKNVAIRVKCKITNPMGGPTIYSTQLWR